jgi:site-specific recombinase XerD
MLPHVDEFLLNLQANNYSLETVYNYERDLNVFDDFLIDCKIEFDALNRRSIVFYKAYLSSRDRKTSGKNNAQKQLDYRSINRMLSSIRGYLRFLIEMDYECPISPETIKLTKTTKRHPQIAELYELVKLVEAPSNIEINPLVAIRNRAMMELLLSTGMRISELCNLNRNQIDETGRVFITGKGRKQRFVYLTQRALTFLNRYLSKRDDNFQALFIPYAGKNAGKINKRISTNYLQERIKSYRNKLKLNIPISAHSLRHGFATYLAEEGASPVALQILLGHESLETTTRYVHASDRYAEEMHRKYHPVAEIDN